MSEIKKHRYQTYSEGKKSIFYNIFQKITLNARNKFFDIFINNTNYSNHKTVIDVGATPSIEKEQNIFLDKTRENLNITCLSNQDCNVLKTKFKNIRNIIIADGRCTGFKDNAFDIVHSNATIEHVGSFENQIAFVKEMLRIAKESIFIQTPNRFYPLDFHTIIPFIHWLPKNIHRKILKYLGLNFYSEEKNLNLLSSKDLKNICRVLKIKKYKIFKHKLFFLTSNLILIIEK